MSTAPNVIPIDAHTSLGSRVGKRYPMRESTDGRFGMTGRGNGMDGAAARALDFFANSAARTGWGTPSLTESTEYILERLSYDYWLLITLYQNHWIARRIVDVPAQDMVRAWPKLTSEIKPKEIAKLDEVIRKKQVKQKLLETIKWARLFGGAGALMVIDGHENILDEPLDFESIELGAFHGLIPFDRWSGIYPFGSVSEDFTKPAEFNLPEMYEVQAVGGQKFQVHASRILRFIGRAVPNPEYQAMTYWGISVLEPAFEELRKRDNVSWNILSLTYRANLIGIQFPELAQALSGAGMSQQALAGFYQRMQALNDMMSNQNLLVLPKDGQISSTQYGFSGLAQIVEQTQLDIAGAANIPVARLFGRTITGLGQSNDQDERIYEEHIAQEQSDQLEPQLDKLYPVLCMSTLGEIPKDLGLKFPSIRVLDEKDKSDLAKTIGDNVNSLVGSGVITRPMALKELKQSSETTGTFTNITDEDIAQAEEDLEAMPDLLKQQEALEGQERVAGAKKKPGRGDAFDSAVLIEYEFAGLPLAIEYPAGMRRTLRNDAGDVVYDRTVEFDYGFIKGTVGRDGDEIDVIVGPNEDAPNVFVVQMKEPTDWAWEHKVFVGFNSEEEARSAYLSMYTAYDIVDISNFPVVDLHGADGAVDAAPFKENEHPREKGGSNAGQFTTKSSGGTISKLKRAPQAEIRPFEVAKFRAPKAGEKVPGGWTNVKVNTDPKADVEMVGVNQYGKPIKKYSASFYARQKEERKKWPAWAQKAGVPGPWTDVHLAPSADHHILASGVDAVGVRKPLYSPSYIKHQSEDKHARIKELDAKIDKIYARVEKDTNNPDDTIHQKARCLELILKYGLRPGGTKQRGKVRSYGALDLESKHVVRDGRNGKLFLRFTGKKGQPNEFEITDPKVAKWLEEAKVNANRPKSKDWQHDYQGYLFPWARTSNLAKYTKEVGAAKTKDFRTRIGTNLGRAAVASIKIPATAKEFKMAREKVGDIVSQKLCNTRGVALSAYINREVFSKWASGLSAKDQAAIKW